MNVLILCLHVTLVSSLTLCALRLGKQVIAAWLCVLAIAMNLFVLKQINLFGLSVTSSDALGVGYLLGLNLIQEYYGRTFARSCVWISLFTACAFLLLSEMHLLYIPNQFDTAHPHFDALLSPMPRVIAASLFTFVVVQLIDIRFFAFLKDKTASRYLTARTVLALLCSQVLDTFLFSYLGLYGLVGSVSDIIILSLAVKAAVILLSAPFITLSKKVVPYAQV